MGVAVPIALAARKREAEEGARLEAARTGMTPTETEAAVDEARAGQRALARFQTARDEGKGLVGSLFRGLGFGKTVGEGLNDDPAALGAATDQALQPVAKRLPQSDAELGPLSRLTAAGAAIPATLAEGVTLGTGTLTDAFSAMLATISGTTSPTLTPEPGPLAAPVPAAPTLAPPEPLVAPALIPAPLATAAPAAPTLTPEPGVPGADAGTADA